jgi:hypothetical protein
LIQGGHECLVLPADIEPVRARFILDERGLVRFGLLEASWAKLLFEIKIDGQ